MSGPMSIRVDSDVIELIAFNSDFAIEDSGDGQRSLLSVGDITYWCDSPGALRTTPRIKAHAFLAQIEKTDSCWLWKGHVNRGYGAYSNTTAHRVSYALFVGPIEEGLELDHLCRIPLCVNPEHLEPVTRAENARRRFALLTHCSRGHEYNEQNTRFEGRNRRCRICEARRTQEWRTRKGQPAMREGVSTDA